MSFRSVVAGKWRWAKSKPLVWANLVLLSGTVAVITFLHGPIVAGIPSDTRLRVWALVLQVIGGATAWYDLTGAARAHGHEGILRGFWAWLKVGLLGQSQIAAVASATSRASAGRLRGKVRAGVRLGMPLWERVQVIESNLQRLDEDLDAALREMDQRNAGLVDMVEQESRRRAEDVDKVRQQLRDSAVSNFGLLVFGAFWVLVGTFLSAVSPEIVRIVAGQWQAVLQSF